MSVAIMRDPSSSSSSFMHPWAFDVFLSFRGEDTRYKFVGHLYQALRERGINAFIDDQELKKGKDISNSLPEAIEKSRISIIIFSENYASSAWCLDELVKIYESMETRGQLVWPIFYEVDPSEVRHQKGSFGIAMAMHENNGRRDPENIQKWKFTLNKVANLSSWHFTSGYESEFIQKVVKEITKILNHAPLHVADHLVGVKSRISHLKSLLNIDSGGIRMIGISGIGGIGKTTIAEAIYNSIAGEFDGASFVADVRENSMKRGLVQLQELLLAKITGDNDIKLTNVNEGITLIQRRLCSMKVLLILDDVTELEHLEKLAGDQEWFGAGSRIIVTTRKKTLLIACGIELIYEMEELCDDEALELFCWHAFKKDKPDIKFQEIAKRAAGITKGLPLALEMIGCNLRSKEPDPNELTWALDKYENIPEKNTESILRISYDDLDRNEKQIFLDLACFFKGEEIEYVENVFDACGLHPKNGIRQLVGKSLIKGGYDIVKMHDLIQQMGREIVRESSSDPGNWSRLWFHEDVLHVLTTNTGTREIQGIMLDLPQREEVQWSGNAFEKMPNLRILIIRNALFSRGPTHLPNTLSLLEWREYPSTSLPEDFHPKKLVELILPSSRFILEAPLLGLRHLTRINFTWCEHLTAIPDMSTVPNLTRLQLNYCRNLVSIHDSVGFLSKLKELEAQGCTKLEKLPKEIALPSLRFLNLDNCSRLQRFPHVLDKMENITNIFMGGTCVLEFPSSMGNLTGLEWLCMNGCTSLSNLPCSMGMLTNLRTVSLGKCPQFFQNCKSYLDVGKLTSLSSVQFRLDIHDNHLSDEDLPVIVSCFPGIIELNLSRNNFVNISACLQELSHLKTLCLDNCQQLQEIQGVPLNVSSISAMNCKSLISQSAWEAFANTAEITMPGNMIRERFDYFCEGGSMSFWVRKKFPMLDIGISLEIAPIRFMRDALCDCHLFLNDILLFRDTQFFDDAEGNHSWILRLDSCIREAYSSQVWWNVHQKDRFDRVDEILQEGWNHVKISWNMGREEDTTADCCGVHVNWEEFSVHDILFEKPDTENACGCAECRQTDEDWEWTIQDHIAGNKDELEVDHNPSVLQEIPSESSIAQQQLINHKIISERSDRVAKENRNGMMVSENQVTMDLGMELLLLYTQNDPMTLECMNNYFLSKNQINSNCIPDNKFSASYKVVGRPNKEELHIRRSPNLGSEFQQESTLEKNFINQKAPFAMAAASLERAQESCETNFSEHLNPLTNACPSIWTFKGSEEKRACMIQESVPEGPMVVEQGGSEHGMITVSNEPHINDMVTFYASLNEEIGDPSSPWSTRVDSESANNRRLREETKEALKILGDFLSNEFSLSMQPEQSSIIVATLNYLLTLSSDGGISATMKSIIQQLWMEFTRWCSEYYDANEKLESSTIELSKMDRLKEDLKSNMARFMEVTSLEKDLEKRMKDLEEQMNAIRAEISVTSLARDMTAKEKVEIFHQGRNLKLQMDELKNQSPRLKDVQESARKTQANIESEWSKLRVQFNKNSF